MGEGFFDTTYGKVIYLIIALIILIIVLRFAILLFPIVILMIIGIVSKMYKLFTGFSIGFELITFPVILIAVKYGVVPAVICAIIMEIMSGFLTGSVGPATLVHIITYIIISVLGAIISGGNIIVVGKSLVLIYLIISQVGLIFSYGFQPHRSLIIIIVTLLVNWYLFNNWAVFFLGVI